MHIAVRSTVYLMIRKIHYLPSTEVPSKPPFSCFPLPPLQVDRYTVYQVSTAEIVIPTTLVPSFISTRHSTHRALLFITPIHVYPINSTPQRNYSRYCSTFCSTRRGCKSCLLIRFARAPLGHLPYNMTPCSLLFPAIKPCTSRCGSFL